MKCINWERKSNFKLKLINNAWVCIHLIKQRMGMYTFDKTTHGYVYI